MSDKPSPILQLSTVGKSYDRQVALANVSFEICSGEFVGLLGPNGAGKSTLFQIISGLFVPDIGTVALFDTSYREDAAKILSQIGVVFQARSIDLEMSVRANLKFHGGLFGLSGKELRHRIEHVADFFEFTDYLDRPVKNLSGGEQRRIEIARALLNQPKLLLMDEPSAGLDATSRQKLVLHMRQLATRENTAILWATHLVDEVDKADKVIILEKGHIVANGSPSELIAQTGTTSLTQAYIALTAQMKKKTDANND